MSVVVLLVISVWYWQCWQFRGLWTAHQMELVTNQPWPTLVEFSRKARPQSTTRQQAPAPPRPLFPSGKASLDQLTGCNPYYSNIKENEDNTPHYLLVGDAGVSLFAEVGVRLCQPSSACYNMSRYLTNL
jgi:hypothetical protein